MAGTAVIFVIASIVAGASWPRRHVEPSDVQPGEGQLDRRPAPDEAFALPSVTLGGFAGGPPVALDDFRGQPLVLYFWATRCAPCVSEMPEFQAAATEFDGRVNFLGVNVEDAPTNAEPFAARVGIEFPLATDPDGDFHRGLGNSGMPTTLLVDHTGVVRYRYTGPLDREQLRELLVEHLDLVL